MRPRCRWVNPGSLDSLGFDLGVVMFIRVRWIHSCESRGSLGSFVCALGVIGFIRGRWFHSCVPWGWLGSPGFVGFPSVLPGDRCVNRVVVFNRVRPEGLWVHPGWLGSLGCVLDVVGFIWGR